MTISQAQLRTLSLLHKKPACRVYRSDRSCDYTWVHDDAQVRLTATLHKLFSSGYATISPDNRNVAVLTAKGREVLAARVVMAAN
jgi:DNA-binding PadR family transcriptional regulator